MCAASHVGEQAFRVLILEGCAACTFRFQYPRLHGVPEIGGDDLQIGSVQADSVLLVALTTFLCALQDDLLVLVPHNLALVERSIKNLAHSGGAQPRGLWRGAGTPSALSRLAMRVKPRPPAYMSKICRTSSASLGFTTRSTCSRCPSADRISRL